MTLPELKALLELRARLLEEINRKLAIVAGDDEDIDG